MGIERDVIEMSKHVTTKDWTGTFDECCDPGDTVDEKIVEHFMNCVPPASMEAGYLQCGEPHSHIADKRNNKFRPTFATFILRDGKWMYCGNCFRGETENRTESGDPWKK